MLYERGELLPGVPRRCAVSVANGSSTYEALQAVGYSAAEAGAGPGPALGPAIQLAWLTQQGELHAARAVNKPTEAASSEFLLRAYCASC